MKTASTLARVLLGILFTVVGLNEFLSFMPMPPVKGVGEQFLTAMTEQTHYIYVVATFEVAGGLLLLAGRYVAPGLTLIGPVVVNILAFHLFMERSGLPLALIVAALALFLLWCYRERFAGLARP